MENMQSFQQGRKIDKNIIIYHGGHNSLSSPIVEKLSSKERLQSFQRFCKAGDTGKISTNFGVLNSAFYTKSMFFCDSAGSS